MRYYETLYIAHPNLELEGLTKLIDSTKGMLAKRGGELLYEEIMGKKRLAYPVRKQRFGTYVLLQFRGDGSGNIRLNQDLELHDDILAHMVVRIEEDEVREQRGEPAEEVASVMADNRPAITDKSQSDTDTTAAAEETVESVAELSETESAPEETAPLEEADAPLAADESAESLQEE